MGRRILECGPRNNGIPEYAAWSHMRQRCLSTFHPQYKDYGGRGIAVCDRWLNSYQNFLTDMGPRPKGHSLDRKDNDGNYEPQNCRWATFQEQNRNTRASRVLVIGGISKCVPEWADLSGIDSIIIHKRLSYGWLPEDAVFAPYQPHGRRFYVSKNKLRSKNNELVSNPQR